MHLLVDYTENLRTGHRSLLYPDSLLSSYLPGPVSIACHTHTHTTYNMGANRLHGDSQPDNYRETE